RLPKSFVVPSLGLLMALIRRSDDPTIHRVLVENSGPGGDSSLYTRTLLEHSASLGATPYLHEWGHIIQNVIYPYLYMRSVRELGLIDKLLLEIQQDKTCTLPTGLSFSRDVFESLTMDVTPFRILVNDEGTVSLGPAIGQHRGRNDISEVDLLE